MLVVSRLPLVGARFRPKRPSGVCQAFICVFQGTGTSVILLGGGFIVLLLSLETMYVYQWNRDGANLLLLWVFGYCLRIARL